MIRYYYDSNGTILAKSRFAPQTAHMIATSYDNSVGTIDCQDNYPMDQYQVDIDAKTLVKTTTE
jgi:hypothetical protein